MLELNDVFHAIILPQTKPTSTRNYLSCNGIFAVSLPANFHQDQSDGARDAFLQSFHFFHCCHVSGLVWVQ